MGESGLAFIFNVIKRAGRRRREGRKHGLPLQARRSIQSLQKYARVYRSMQEFTEVCKSLQKYARVLQKYARVCMKWYTVLLIRVRTFDLLGSHSAKSPDCLPSTHV